MGHSNTDSDVRLYNPFVFRAGNVMAGVGVGCGIGLGIGRPINIGAFPAIGPSIVSSFGDVSNSIVQYGRPVIMALRKMGLKNLEGGIGCGFGIGYGYGIGLTLKPGVDQKIMVFFQNASSQIIQKFQTQIQNQASESKENTSPNFQSIAFNFVYNFVKNSPYSSILNSPTAPKLDPPVAFGNVVSESKTVAVSHSIENVLSNENGLQFFPTNPPQSVSTNEVVSADPAQKFSYNALVPEKNIGPFPAEESRGKEKIFPVNDLGFDPDDKLKIEGNQNEFGKEFGAQDISQNTLVNGKRVASEKLVKKISELNLSAEDKKAMENLLAEYEKDLEHYKTSNQILIAMIRQQNEIDALKSEIQSLKDGFTNDQEEVDKDRQKRRTKSRKTI